jgi:glycosyltransferase involved in cell wall biosynthesis
MISVIVPIYNVKDYLIPCIESIINQIFTDLEIILVDDGSTDGCSEICDKYQEIDSRILVIHKENEGLVSARKAGLKAAHGSYIAYVDGDDWIEPIMYEHMYQELCRQDVDIVMCGRYEDTGKISREVFHGIPEGRYGKEELINYVYPQMIVGDDFFEWMIFPGLWDKLFRRKCVEMFQYMVDNRITMGEDAACTYPCLLNADSIYIIHQCLYHYRQTTSSMVKKVQSNEIEQERFQILYQSVNKCFEQYAGIFDVREQWKKYVLFLMLPRADTLYKDFENLEYLFPFYQVKKGSSIILYGAGTYGQRLYQYLKKSRFCSVSAWVDRNYIQLSEMGLEVVNPLVIPQKKCNVIVIANTYKKSRTLLCQELREKYPEKRIYTIDEKCIFTQEAMRAFGLMEG